MSWLLIEFCDGYILHILIEKKTQIECVSVRKRFGWLIYTTLYVVLIKCKIVCFLYLGVVAQRDLEKRRCKFERIVWWNYASLYIAQWVVMKCRTICFFVSFFCHTICKPNQDENSNICVNCGLNFVMDTYCTY